MSKVDPRDFEISLAVAIWAIAGLALAMFAPRDWVVVTLFVFAAGAVVLSVLRRTLSGLTWTYRIGWSATLIVPLVAVMRLAAWSVAPVPEAVVGAYSWLIWNMWVVCLLAAALIAVGLVAALNRVFSPRQQPVED